MSSVTDVSDGDYVLPVGMTDLQKKVTSAVVSSNFSEILSYFDGNEQSRTRYKEKLSRMMDDLNLVATHPYLLLTHLQPSLGGKRAPSAIENMSGKFQSLVTLAKKFTKPNQNVAVVCQAGQATDLVESVLSDRALNIRRYSSQSDTKLYKKEIQKRRGATFHLVPSELKDLKEAVYAAFDVMIVLDNTFDIHSDYGRGLRAQLRDPYHRRPYASVIRLVALNSAQHIELVPNLNFSEQIAAVVVLNKNAGAMTSVVKQFYARDMSQLNEFVSKPDGPFPLPGLPPIKRVGHKEVERALYLDDEDQYQVDFANRKVGGRRKAAHASADDLASEDDESGSDEAAASSNSNGNSHSSNSNNSSSVNSVAAIIGANGVKLEEESSIQMLEPEVKPPAKRRRIELEDEAVQICESLSIARPFSMRLLVEFNECLAQSRLHKAELESHRTLASNREHELERQREHMLSLARKVLDLEKQYSSAERRSEKLLTRNEKLEAETLDTEKWWKKITDELKLAKDEAGRHETLINKIVDLQALSDLQKKSLESERSRYSHLQSVSHASSEYADNLAKERDGLLEQVTQLKSKLEEEPLAKELAVTERLNMKTTEANALRAELENLKESVKIQLANDRSTGRGDRRFGGRGGRGSGLNKHNS